MGALTIGGLAVRPTSLTRPAEGEHCSGDAVAWWSESEALWLVVLDVAGHGDAAAAVATTALALLMEPGPAQPTDRLGRHQSADLGRPTAVALGRLGPEAPVLELVMVGNVRLQVLSGPGAPSVHEGQAGMWAGRFPNLRPVRVPLSPGQRVLLHSDGMASSTRLDSLPSGMSPHPLLSALAARWGRPHDDLSCLLLDIFDGNRWPPAD